MASNRERQHSRRDGRRPGARDTRRSLRPAGGVLRALVAVGVVVVVAVMLLGPLRDWYVAWRANEQLMATYDQLAEENADLQDDIDYLCSREGIENEARELGYVEEGETRVMVTDEDDSGAESSTFTTAKPEVDITEGEPWYFEVLDTLFGYEGVS